MRGCGAIECSLVRLSDKAFATITVQQVQQWLELRSCNIGTGHFDHRMRGPTVQCTIDMTMIEGNTRGSYNNHYEVCQSQPAEHPEPGAKTQLPSGRQVYFALWNRSQTSSAR
jgi:hypothetical protein